MSASTTRSRLREILKTVQPGAFINGESNWATMTRFVAVVCGLAVPLAGCTDDASSGGWQRSASRNAQTSHTAVSHIAANGRFWLTTANEPGLERPTEGRSCVFQTQSIRRGSVELSTGVARTRRNHDDTWTIDRGVGIEHLRRLAGGLEQRWTFASPPSGTGDLHVRIAVEGCSGKPCAYGLYRSGPSGGLHPVPSGQLCLRHQTTPLALRYSAATWIDARGQRTHVPAVWQDQSIVLTVPHGVVQHSPYPAVLDPEIFPALQLDADLTTDTPDADPPVPALAFDGSHYLVIWAEYDSHWDIRGAWLDPNDSQTVPTSFAIATDPGNQLNPRVACETAPAATKCLASWWDANSLEVKAAFVQFGTTVGTSFALSDTSSACPQPPQGPPTVVFGDGQFIAAWENPCKDAVADEHWGIEFRIVLLTGQMTDINDLGIANGADTNPALSFNGTDYLLAWQHGGKDGPLRRNVMSRRIPPSGATPLPVALVTVAGTSNDETQPAISCQQAGDYQGECLIVWQRYETMLPDRKLDIRAARLNLAGEISQGDILVSGEPADQQLAAVSYALDEYSYLVAWQGANGHIEGVWVRHDGQIIDPQIWQLPNEGNVDGTPALAADGAQRGRMLLAFRRESASSATLVTRVIESGAHVGAACVEDNDCTTRHCQEQVCCRQQCSPCERCDQNPGDCTPVVNQDDDSCGETKTCDAFGQCALKNGQPCSGPTECASGYCADQICCDEACDQSCAACNIVPGSCVAVPVGHEGDPKCGLYKCIGEKSCPEGCTHDSHCVSGTCDLERQQCVTDPTCKTDGRTLEAPNGYRTDCSPYGCRGAACLQKCAASIDCVSPFVCDPAARCVLPPSDSSRGDHSACNCQLIGGGRSPVRRLLGWFLLVGFAAWCRRRRHALA